MLRRPATPDDPASSRFGESIYAFWPRTVKGSLTSAWHLETERLRRLEQGPWTVRNDLLNAWAMSAVLFAGLTLGCFNAWHWVAREDEAIHRKPGEHDAGG